MKRFVFIFALILLFSSFASAGTSLNFVDPTPADGSTNPGTSLAINVSSSGSYHYTITDFDKDLRLWMTFQHINSSGGFIDNSSWGNNGSRTNVNILTGGRFGNMSQYLASNSRVTIPDSVSLKGLTYVTISAWVNSSATLSDRVIAGKHSGGVGGEYFIGTTGTPTLRFTVINASGTRANCDFSYTFNTGQWILVTGSYNGTTPLLYINGTQVNAICDASVTGKLQSTTNPFIIGDYNAGGQPWNGTIDDVMVWNRSLTSTEIATLYNATASQYYRNFTNLNTGAYRVKSYGVNATAYTDTISRNLILGTLNPSISSYTINNINISNWWMRPNQNVNLNISCSDGMSTEYSYAWYVNDIIESFSQDPLFNFDPTEAHDSEVIGVRNNITVSCSNGIGTDVWKSFNVEVLNSDDVVFVALPDTQYYSQTYPHIFNNQTNWISQMKNWFNLSFVVHEGDIVQNGNVSSEWAAANLSMRIIDNANQNYEVTSGNHDYNYISNITDRNLTLFNNFFPLSRFSSMSTYEGSFNGTAANQYHVVSTGGRDYLFLTYEFCPRNETLDWANSIIEANPNKYVIITTHMYLNDDGTLTNATFGYSCQAYNIGNTGNDGIQQWNYTVKRYNNIFLVLSGHVIDHGGAANLTLTGLNGNTVNQIVANYQSETGNPNGGNGWLRVYIMKPSSSLITAETYSPYLDVLNTTTEVQDFSLFQNFSYLQIPTNSSTNPVFNGLINQFTISATLIGLVILALLFGIAIKALLSFVNNGTIDWQQLLVEIVIALFIGFVMIIYVFFFEKIGAIT